MRGGASRVFLLLIMLPVCWGYLAGMQKNISFARNDPWAEVTFYVQ